jgi:hypothetical protein
LTEITSRGSGDGYYERRDGGGGAAAEPDEVVESDGPLSDFIVETEEETEEETEDEHQHEGSSADDDDNDDAEHIEVQGEGNSWDADQSIGWNGTIAAEPDEALANGTGKIHSSILLLTSTSTDTVLDYFDLH